VSADRFSRIFDVLELLAHSSEGRTLTEISKRLDLPLSSTHNLLQRMVKTNVVTVTDGLRYSIGARAVRLGILVLDGLDVRVIARRYLQDLARETGEHVYLAIRLGQRVVYVDRAPGTRPVTVDIRLGQSLFLHATSVGKLFSAHEPLLRQRLFREDRRRLTDRTLTEPQELEAELDRIRADGYAISREEAIEGVVGLAVPIRDANGNLTAAIHISALRAQINPKRERELIELASASAMSIERDLGRAPSREATMGPDRVREREASLDGSRRAAHQRGSRLAAAPPSKKGRASSSSA
jgi:DNA-binding IclR family transcriptional regulator